MLASRHLVHCCFLCLCVWRGCLRTTHSEEKGIDTVCPEMTVVLVSAVLVFFSNFGLIALKKTKKNINAGDIHE